MLDKYNKNKNPFKVPENYFENLTENVMSNLPVQKEEIQVKKVSLWKKVLPWASVAAIIAAVAISVNLTGEMPKVLAGKTKQKEIQTQRQLAYNEVEDYFLFLEDESMESMYEEVLFEEE